MGDNCDSSIISISISSDGIASAAEIANLCSDCPLCLLAPRYSPCCNADYYPPVIHCKSIFPLLHPSASSMGSDARSQHS